MLAKIDKNLRYFDDLIKEQLRTKIEHEREYMQMLKEGESGNFKDSVEHVVHHYLM